MQNEEVQNMDLYIPWKCSTTNRLITSKDHASVQINIGHLDDTGRYTGQFSTFALCGFIRVQIHWPILNLCSLWFHSSPDKLAEEKNRLIAPKRFVQRLRKENDVFSGYMHQWKMSSGTGASDVDAHSWIL